MGGGADRRRPDELGDPAVAPPDRGGPPIQGTLRLALPKGSLEAAT
jgi:hypothetical protein